MYFAAPGRDGGWEGVHDMGKDLFTVTSVARSEYIYDIINAHNSESYNRARAIHIGTRGTPVRILLPVYTCAAVAAAVDDNDRVDNI